MKAREQLKPAYDQVKYSPPVESFGLEMVAAQADSLTITSGGALSQNFLAELLLIPDLTKK